MRFASAIARDHDLESACRAAAATARDRLGGIAADFAIAFVSPRYGHDIERAAIWLGEHLGTRTLCGCTGGGIIGGGIEVEDQRAVAVLAAKLPGVTTHVLELGNGDLPDADGPPSAWHQLLPEPPDRVRAFLVLPEPFHFDAQALLAGLDFAWPSVPKIGGIASGSRHPDGHGLLIGRRVVRTGALLIALCGNIDVQAVVAQGCKPLGAIGKVTRCAGQRVDQIDGMPAMQFLQAQLRQLADAEEELTPHNPLFFGIAMDAFADPAAPGEFLIRNIHGVDPAGRLMVGEAPGTGRLVQFHIRDSATSALDLQQLLARGHVESARGALLFSCLGRGKALYGRTGHDSDLFFAAAGEVPLVGFFCNGEIGPVGGSTFLHGYTSSFAIFRPASAGNHG